MGFFPGLAWAMDWPIVFDGVTLRPSTVKRIEFEIPAVEDVLLGSLKMWDMNYKMPGPTMITTIWLRDGRVLEWRGWNPHFDPGYGLRLLNR